MEVDFLKLNDKIKALRARKGLTQKALSELTGISIRTIINYETYGKVPKNRKALEALAKALDVDVSYLAQDKKECALSNDDRISEETKTSLLLYDATSFISNTNISDKQKEHFVLSINEAYWKFLSKQRKGK